jgi:hypothetical protein
MPIEALKRVVILLSLVALGGAGWATVRLWPRQLDPRVPMAAPVVMFQDDQMALRVPAAAIAAEVGIYSDQLLAYLNSQYLWSRVSQQKDGTEVVLIQNTDGRKVFYRMFVVVPNDLLTAIPFLSKLKTEGYISRYRLLYWTRSQLEFRQAASQILEASYRLPASLSFDALEERRMVGPLTSFILFKSRTDRRVRERIKPVPPPLTLAEARRQAEDMIEVARFYNLPLDSFAGIAAQENNYLNADGDLAHAVWKRRAAPGDVVLKRRRGRVLVSDYSMGVWQITRESLRYAHLLYLKDERNYSLLPARLRPSRDLHLDAIQPDVLTTYAGLLFRQLIDHFHGDIALALGAYNGGCGDPNADYSASVAVAAGFARRTVEQSTALDGWKVIPIKIVPYSPPPQTHFHPSFGDSLRGKANEILGEIVDRVQSHGSGRPQSTEVAVSQD